MKSIDQQNFFRFYSELVLKAPIQTTILVFKIEQVDQFKIIELEVKSYYIVPHRNTF